MPDPPKTLRQKLVDAVVARMREIRIANGYQTDIGATVEDWRTHFEQDELPAIGVYDLTQTTEKTDKEQKRTPNTLPVQIRIFAASNTLVTDLRVMIGDVLAAIKKDQRWGKLALDTKPKQDGFIIPKESFEVAGAAVEIEIEYLSDTFDPYK
jgi:hypothetical protein